MIKKVTLRVWIKIPDTIAQFGISYEQNHYQTIAKISCINKECDSLNFTKAINYQDTATTSEIRNLIR